MSNAGHYIGTEPRRAVGSPAIVWVLLCRSIVEVVVLVAGMVGER